ncbi:MAG: redoxin domain-containing protein [Planctomycetia bacterium]|nr:redoxin domain-containing protein [Planctomycetia bacterium]
MLATVGQLILMTVLTASGMDLIGDNAALELRYAGTLAKVGRNGAEQPLKKFTLYSVVTKQGDGKRLAYLTDERGGGSWAWPERFGILALNPKNAAADGSTIRVLADHEGVPHPISVRQPLFEFADKLGDDGEEVEDDWTSGQSSYEVAEETKKLKDRECYVIRVSTNNGRKQRLWVSKADKTLVVAAEQQVFMGRGEEFLLKLELESTKPVDAGAFEKLNKPLQTLLDLKSQINRPDGETKTELNADQIKTAKKVIAALEKQAEGTPFATLAAVVSRDVKAQTQRTDDVDSLSKKFVGQMAPEFELTTLDKKTVRSKDLAGKIVVLHFWDYEGEPLAEPYGQVGYLDFLANKRKKFGIEVVGVAVNESFADGAKANGALRSVRKLREFMNLSYPIGIDDSTLLAKFGDPRKLGAKLPLWVVINPDGKIAHYQVGFYAIKPDEGLRPLDEAVMKQIKTK